MSLKTRMQRKAARGAERSQGSEQNAHSLLLDDVADHIQPRIEENVPGFCPSLRDGGDQAHHTDPVHTFDRPQLHEHRIARPLCQRECQTAVSGDADRPERQTAGTPQGEYPPEFPGQPANPLVPDQPAVAREAMTTSSAGGSSPPPPGRPESPSPEGTGRRFRTSEEWLWPGKIRSGDLSVVVGESGAGVSTLVSDWIARLTRGLPFPGCGSTESHTRGEVLVFNTVEGYSSTVLPRIVGMGGDSSQVLLASEQLLAWGAGELPGDQPPQEGLEAETRVRLQTSAALTRLDQLLRRRPTIRLIVIDQLKQHIRCDSERVFEGLIHDLTSIARRNDVAIVLTQAPDAFRKSGGASRFLKSPSLVQSARSIWRIVCSDSDRFGERVLDCLKLSHPVQGDKPGPWHLRLSGQGLPEWLRGRGGALLASSSAYHEQGLKTACRFLERELQIKEGVARWHDLVRQANDNGIDVRWLRDAVLKMNLDSSFSVSGGFELMRLVGYPEDMVSIQRGLDASLSRNSEDLRIFESRALEPSRPWRGEEEEDAPRDTVAIEGASDAGGWESPTEEYRTAPESEWVSSGSCRPPCAVVPLEGTTPPGPAGDHSASASAHGKPFRSIKPEVGMTGERGGDVPVPGSGEPVLQGGEGWIQAVLSRSRVG